MKKFLLKTHIYLGLFTAPYLLILALSSLHFNHPFLTDGSSKVEANVHEVSLDSTLELSTQSDSLKKKLDLMGWFIPWESYQKKDSLYLKISQPGIDYKAKGSFTTNQVRLERHFKGARSILFVMHGLSEEIPGAPWWVNLWPYYQDITIYSMLFWLVTGVYLWSKQKRNPAYERYLLLGFPIVSLLIMIWIWYGG